MQQRRIAVDLTPVLPGGENGGAKLVVLGLIQHLSRIAPDTNFVLLTEARSHTELGLLDAANVRRICVSGKEKSSGRRRETGKMWIRPLHAWLVRRLPSQVIVKLKAMYRANVLQPRRSALLKNLHVDLLFCPFTESRFYDSTIPMVSVIYDLQHRTYPQFFSAEERFQRDWNFREACRVANQVVCISHYVRNTVLETAAISPQKVKTIYIRLPCRLQHNTPAQTTEVLDRWGLKSERFLLYPANFWPHKNHRMLLTAFGMFIARHPQSDLQLVCTGALEAPLESLRTATARMGLEKRISFPGFLPDNALAALLQSCRALLFPSLYEGFGMPVLEAMAFGKPVLCSNVTSLPEITDDAALFFDPRKPAEIVNAISQIEEDSALVARLIARGYQRAQQFGDPNEMAQQYLQVFREVIGDSHRSGR